MKTLIHAAIAALVLTAVAAFAAEAVPPKANPFDQASQASFAGRFHGPGVQMRLKPEGGAWTGTIVFQARYTQGRYTVRAALRSGALEGSYGDGQQTWPFSLRDEGDKLSFTAGSFEAALQRQALPVTQGVYKSQSTEVEFLNKDGGTNGIITFKGQRFQFTVSEVAGELEGTFQNGAQTFQFSLVPENKGWDFKTAQFSDVLSLPARPADDFRAAAARAEANAQYSLGWCFANGCGVARDYAEAAKWYRKAAEQGNADAQYKLGVCYDNGQGVARDFSEAVKWYRKAAEQKNSPGGSLLESEDIRTWAKKMTASLLSLPQIAGEPGGAYVAIAPITNSSRHVVDENTFMATWRIELNQASQGRIRFFSQGVGQETRMAKAKWLLTGKLDGLSMGVSGGGTQHYFLMSFRLVDPESNKICWEDSCETMRMSRSSVLSK